MQSAQHRPKHCSGSVHSLHPHSTIEKAVNLQLVPLQTANTCRDCCTLQTVGTLQTHIESAAHCSLHCRQMPRLLHSAHHADRESCGFIPRFVLELQQQIGNFICHPYLPHNALSSSPSVWPWSELEISLKRMTMLLAPFGDNIFPDQCRKRHSKPGSTGDTCHTLAWGLSWAPSRTQN